jgi:hypothetical protein
MLVCIGRFYEGGYLYLKSSIMRTQGAKEQRTAVIDTPRKNMKVVVEVNAFHCSIVCAKSVSSGTRTN